jgi:vancomycin resistance protein YoaR
MPRRPPKIVIGIAAPVIALVLLLAAWAIDSSAGNATVSRNVEIGDKDISKLREDKVVAVVKDLSDDFSKTKVSIETSKAKYESTAGKLGLEIDQDATVAEALDAGKDDALPIQPVLWLASFVAPRKADVQYKVREDVLTMELALLQGDDAVQPAEPAIVASTDVVGVRAGTPGSALDPKTVADRLIEDAEKGESPIEISGRPVERKPKVDPDQASALADDLTAKTANGLAVKIQGLTGQVTSATVRSWLSSKVENDELVAVIDAEKAKADVLTAVGPLSGVKKNASFDVVDGQVRINPSADGFTCCNETTGERVLDAVTKGAPELDLTEAVVPDKPDFTTADAEKLGIKEPIGTTTEWKGQQQVKSFTTYHAGGEPRVTNIHKMADIVRGAIIKPGETFSLNDRVGKRTKENGFVEAGAIADGVHVQEVGGGVSQFSTTLFNAAFFAGLDLMSHQAHSEYFDRYPRGREATLGFPNPDNRIRNNSPYGMLIWTSYTNTSITVTIYSTQWAWGEQTAISEAPTGPCTKVTVTRTRHFPDRPDKSEDYYATYRPAEGVKCP